MNVVLVRRRRPFTSLLCGGGGRKGSGDSSSSIKTSCPDKIVAAQSHCSIKSHDLNSKYRQVKKNCSPSVGKTRSPPVGLTVFCLMEKSLESKSLVDL